MQLNHNSQNLIKEQVLTKAILKMALFCELSGKDLAAILGISESTITRLGQGKKYLTLHNKEGEMALLLLRMYRSLNTLVGSHDKARLWLTHYNHYFKAIPLEHMKKITGLVEVVNYLDAMRGKL